MYSLLGLRHDPQSVESVRALNMIDVVFADDHAVREAWTRYITTLNDPALNEGIGFAIRDEKRRELLLEIVKSLGLAGKISSTDLLRSYMPTFAAETAQPRDNGAGYKRTLYDEYLKTKGVSYPVFWPPPEAPPSPPVPPPGGNPSKPAHQ
jgi:hypothetical protein